MTTNDSGVDVPHTDHPLRHYDRTCPACNPRVRACDPTQAERRRYAGVLRCVIECLRSTGRFTDDEGEMTNELEDLLVILEARTPGVRVPPAGPLTDMQVFDLLPDPQSGWTLTTYGLRVARAVERAHGIHASGVVGTLKENGNG